MANEQYDLQVLLDLREGARKAAEEALAAEMAVLEQRRRAAVAAREALAQAERGRVAEVAAFDARRMAQGVEIAVWRAFDDYVRGLKAREAELAEAIRAAERAVVAQQAQVKRANEALLAATQEVEAVEQHRAQWQAEQRLEQARKDDDAMDDVAVRLWRSQQR
jgi:flagellar export protein FliJ